MTTKASGKAGAPGKGTPAHLKVAHRIEVLLHTMRAIERHEEQLCVVMTEIRNAGAVRPGTRKELLALLEELPSAAYGADLDAVGAALAATTTTRRASPAGKGEGPSRPKRKLRAK